MSLLLCSERLTLPVTVCLAALMPLQAALRSSGIHDAGAAAGAITVCESMPFYRHCCALLSSLPSLARPPACAPCSAVLAARTFCRHTKAASLSARCPSVVKPARLRFPLTWTAHHQLAPAAVIHACSAARAPTRAIMARASCGRATAHVRSDCVLLLPFALLLLAPLAAFAAVDTSTCSAGDCCWSESNKERFCACTQAVRRRSPTVAQPVRNPCAAVNCLVGPPPGACEGPVTPPSKAPPTPPSKGPPGPRGGGDSTCVCTADYSPVCARGKTYPNACTVRKRVGSKGRAVSLHRIASVVVCSSSLTPHLCADTRPCCAARRAAPASATSSRANAGGRAAAMSFGHSRAAAVMSSSRRAAAVMLSSRRAAAVTSSGRRAVAAMSFGPGRRAAARAAVAQAAASLLERAHAYVPSITDE